MIMVMKRAKFWPNVIADMGLVNCGMGFWYQILGDQNHWMWLANLIAGAAMFGTGYCDLIKVVQSIEVDELAITHQNGGRITRVQWKEINSFSLNEKRFLALGKQGEILLDLSLIANNDKEWPVAECAQIRKFIERKMNEVGAFQTSRLWLRHNRGIKIKP